MGILDRYKKPGGFLQLLTLIETSETNKREKFLQMIKEESPLWEETLKAHMLSIEIVFSWPTEVLSEITSRIQPINLAGVLKSLPETEHQKVFLAQSPMNRRKIEEFYYEKQFNPSEVLVAIEKFLIETRNLCTQGVIKLDKIDHKLTIEDGIEERLSSNPKSKTNSNTKSNINTVTSQSSQHPAQSTTSSPSATATLASTTTTMDSSATGSAEYSTNDELLVIRKRVAGLLTEVQNLKQENIQLKDKLDRIRKIA